MRTVFQLLRQRQSSIQLLRAGVGSLVIKAASAFLAFSLSVVLARALGTEGYGIYSFSLAVLMFTAIPAQVGIPQLVLRETAKAHAREEWALIRGLWRWSNISVAAFSAIALVVAYILIAIAPFGSSSDRRVTLSVGLLLVPLVALANVRGASLRGLRKVVWGQIPEGAIRPATQLLLVGCSMLVVAPGSGITAECAMALYVTSAAFAFMIGSWMLRKAKPVELLIKTPSKYEARYWWRAVIPLAAISGLQLINNYVDLLVVGIYQSDSAVGIYRAATQLSMLIIFGFQALNQVFQPYYARHAASADIESLQKLVTFSSRLIILSSLPPVFLIFGYPNVIIQLVFGESYTAGSGVLLILAASQLINALFGALGVLLNMLGMEKITLYWVGWAAISNIALTVLLVPIYGMEGAAIASAVSLVFYNCVLYRAVRLTLGLNTLPFKFFNPRRA